MPNSEILANYRLDLTTEGAAKLQKAGLSGTFPAIVRTSDPNRTYYFAGDFADIDKTPFTWQVSFLAQIRKVFTADLPGWQDSFYWKVYYPVIEKILTEVRNE